MLFNQHPNLSKTNEIEKDKRLFDFNLEFYKILFSHLSEEEKKLLFKYFDDFSKSCFKMQRDIMFHIYSISGLDLNEQDRNKMNQIENKLYENVFNNGAIGALNDFENLVDGLNPNKEKIKQKLKIEANYCQNENHKICGSPNMSGEEKQKKCILNEERWNRLYARVDNHNSFLELNEEEKTKKLTKYFQKIKEGNESILDTKTFSNCIFTIEDEILCHLNPQDKEKAKNALDKIDESMKENSAKIVIVSQNFLVYFSNIIMNTVPKFTESENEKLKNLEEMIDDSILDTTQGPIPDTTHCSMPCRKHKDKETSCCCEIF